jgi:hypothetical protein
MDHLSPEFDTDADRAKTAADPNARGLTLAARFTPPTRQIVAEHARRCNQLQPGC